MRTRLRLACIATAIPLAVASATAVQRVTLVGCFQLDESGAYLLTDAVEESSSPDETSSGQEPATYSVVGVAPPGVRPPNHENHQVRVTGTITEASSPDELSEIFMRDFEHVAPTCSERS